MNASKNSFRQMLEEDERSFPIPPDIEENVIGSLQVLTMMGHAMELFIPKAFEMFILTLGGTVKELDTATDNTAPISGGQSEDTGDDAPGSAPDNPII